MKFCDTQEEAVRLLCQGDQTGEMQSCIRTRSPEMLRVHWSQSKIEVFMVRSTDLNKDKHSSSLSRIIHRSKVEVSMYQHKPSDFVYAGKLLRSSFSPYCPYKSVLSPNSLSPSPCTKLSYRDTGRNATTERTPHRDLSNGERKSIFPQMFWDADLHGAQIVKLESKYPFLETMGEALISAIETWRKLPTGSFNEVVFDCVLGSDAHCYLLRCLGVSPSSPILSPSPGLAVAEESASLTDSDSEEKPIRRTGSPQAIWVKKTVFVKGNSRADNIEFYEKSIKMKKNGMVPFKIIGVHAKNHEPQLLTTFQERLDPLLRAHRQRKKQPIPKSDTISDFMTKVENSYDELRVKARQSKFDMEDIRKIVSNIIKDTNFGERVFFSFFERTRMVAQISDVFANKTREEIKQVRAKFIEILQNVNLLTTPPRYRPTATSVGITSEQYGLFDGILQKVLEIEDLPQLIIPITKERIFILVGEILEGI